MSKFAKIIKGFTKTINELDKLVDSNDAKCAWHHAGITEREEAIVALSAESDQASAVSAKLKELLK